MKIIRPQQCAVLCNRIEIGGEHSLGISVAIGWQLGKPERLVHEARLWRALERSPINPGILDTAEPKPFAEWMVIGKAAGSTRKDLVDIRVKIGEARAEVTIEEGRQLPFMPVSPMDKRRLQYLPGGEAYDEVYLESTYPGYPAQTDARYFQQASDQQWLTRISWPDTIGYEFGGVAGAASNLPGIVPAVNARILAWPGGGHEGTPIDIAAVRKTIWFFLEEDIGIVVCTGEVRLAHDLDEPIADLMIGIEACGRSHPLAYYADIRTRRRTPLTGDLDSMLDDELLPDEADPEVIRTLTDHPSSILHAPGTLPAGAAAAHYNDLRDARDAVADSRNSGSGGKPQGPTQQAASIHPEWQNEPGRSCTDATFYGDTFTGPVLAGRKFSRVTFHSCHIENASLAASVFEHCIFQACCFHACSGDTVVWDGGRFEECQLENVDLLNTTIKGTVIQGCTLKKVGLVRCALDQLICDRSAWELCQLEDCLLEDNAWSHSSLNESMLLRTRIATSLFEECGGSAVTIQEGELTACSFFKGEWTALTFTATTLERVTFGAPIHLEKACFTDVSMRKTGMTRVSLQGASMLRCSAHEVSLMHADLRGSTIRECDFDGIMLRQADLTGAILDGTTLCDADLYGARMESAMVRQCDLTGADLAMASLAQDTRINDCLTDGVRWVPRRVSTRAAA